jgi:hypothetical protein
MFPQFPIAALIARRKAELRISSAEIVRRAGYKERQWRIAASRRFVLEPIQAREPDS